MASPSQVYQCNVAIFGKTGAGKSTVANAIAGADRFKVKTSVSSATEGSKYCISSYKDDVNGHVYNVKIVDTVGLFDTGKKTNKQIINEMKTFFCRHVPEGISLILFVFREGRFTPEERETFQLIIDNFAQDISDISALIVIGCDSKGSKARDGVIKEFETNDVTRDIAALMKEGIYPVGFPPMEEIDEDMVENMTKKIETDKKTVIDLVKKNHELRLAEEMFSMSFWEKCSIL